MLYTAKAMAALFALMSGSAAALMMSVIAIEIHLTRRDARRELSRRERVKKLFRTLEAD